MTIEEHKKQICEIGHRVWQLGWVAANDGNISVKIGENRFLATPTGISKSFLVPEMIIEVDGEGKVLDGNTKYRPSSELPMHLRCYKERDDLNAVIHAHPPTATGFAIHDARSDYIFGKRAYRKVRHTVHTGSPRFGCGISSRTRRNTA